MSDDDKSDAAVVMPVDAAPVAASPVAAPAAAPVAAPALVAVPPCPMSNLNMSQCVNAFKCPFRDYGDLEADLKHLPVCPEYTQPNLYVSKPSNEEVPPEWYDTVIGTSQRDSRGDMIPYSVALANAVNYGQGIIWGPGVAQYDLDNDIQKGDKKFKSTAACLNAANRSNFEDALKLAIAELVALGFDPIEAASHVFLTHLKKDETIPGDDPILKLKLSQLSKNANERNYLYCRRCYKATTSTPKDEVVVHPIAKFEFRTLRVEGDDDDGGKEGDGNGGKEDDNEDSEKQARSGFIKGGVKLLEVYLHNMECCVPEGQRRTDLCTNNDCGSNFFTSYSPTAAIVGHTYEFLLNHGNSEILEGRIPPGDEVDNGIPGYPYDDRRIITLPARIESGYFKEGSTPAHHLEHRMSHRYTMFRLSAFVSMQLNITSQFTTQFGPKERHFPRLVDTGVQPHVYFKNSFVSTMGYQKKQGTVIHQPPRSDIADISVMDEHGNLVTYDCATNPKLKYLQKPGLCTFVLNGEPRIYRYSPQGLVDNTNVITLREQRFNFIPGSFVYGGVTEEMPKDGCLLYTSPSPRDQRGSRMPSSA